MTGFTVFVIVVVVAMVVALLITLSAIAAKKKREAYAALVAATGWRLAERDDSVIDLFSGSPFGQGHARHANQVLSGTVGNRSMVAFEYTYDTTTTDTDTDGHTTTREESHHYHIVALGLGAAVPRLDLTPEGFFSRAIGRLTNSDIELESEDFNRAFTLSGEDRKFASDIMHPQMMEYLLAYPKQSLRFVGSHCLTIEFGTLDPTEIQPRVDYLIGVADKVPAFVRQAYGLT